jgi:hypothetical protein
MELLWGVFPFFILGLTAWSVKRSRAEQQALIRKSVRERSERVLALTSVIQ